MRNFFALKFVSVTALILAALTNTQLANAHEDPNSVSTDAASCNPLLAQAGQMQVENGQLMMQPGQMPMQMQAGQVPMQMQPGQVPMQMQPGQVPMQMQPGQVPMQMQPGQVPMQMQPGQIPMQMQPGQVPMQMQPGQMPVQMQPAQPSNGSALFSFPEKLIDFNSARSAKTELDLESAQFLDAAVDRLHMTLKNLDMRQGVVGNLDLLVLGGHFQEFTVDQLRITSTNPLAFSTDAFLNHRSFDFGNPVIASVSAVVSQNSLNKFLAAPRTLQVLSAGAQNHLPGFLSELVGAALQVQFQSAKLNLMANNRVQIDVLADINLLKNVSRIPITVNTQLGLANGWVNLSDTQISSSGQAISPELSSMVVGRINNLAKWGKHNEDMQFAFTQINVIPGNRFELMGTAQIKRLRFGT